MNTSMSTAPRGVGWRFGLGTLLSMAMAMGAFTQAALGVLAPPIIDELGITRGELGALASVIYVCAAVVARTSGGVIDTLGGRRMLFVLFGAGSAAVLTAGAAGTFWWLAAAALVAGVAAGVNNPVTNKLIAEYTEPGRQALLVGTKQAGVKVAHFAVGFALPPLAVAFGWRVAITTGALVGALGSLGALALLPRQPLRRVAPRTAAVDGSSVGRQILWLRAYAILMAMGLGAFNTYLPLYAVEGVGFSLTAAGAAAGVSGVIAAASRLLWAYVTERFGRPPGWLGVLSVGGVVFIGILAAAQTLGPVWLWVGALGMGATGGTWAVVGQFTVIRENREDAGRASGFLQAAFLTGLAVGAPLFGVVVDRLDSYLVGWSIMGCMWAGAAVVAGRELRRRMRSERRAQAGAIR